MNTLQTIVSEHGSAVDGLGVKETISRLVVGQISYKVRYVSSFTDV